ncbi:hypothetical protein SARC_00397 [Sphaeroforma arctica JP610]|uniref:Uncharacterized protein n=1 Tax=Sphaeroforma arctica JP610 TaxID=667725 RepID=A0A0L0GES2_9EUKA|nr:hypothetical protein SARC_00397 [Sphaeroforma arctica JP610]KNC87512.1 hypothetical protein SARC_00397 [Sphaeroforma arctica JP610]|eukprot:XP_014161414.1 hypothetical protein SARC_00397 [Sphaeroforma arctica JP610]
MLYCYDIEKTIKHHKLKSLKDTPGNAEEMVKGKSKKLSKRFSRTPKGPRRKGNVLKPEVSQAKRVPMPPDWVRISPSAGEIIQRAKRSSECICVTKANMNGYAFNGVGKVGVWAPKDMVERFRQQSAHASTTQLNGKT